MDELLRSLLDLPAAERLSYGELFHRHLGIDPHAPSPSRLHRIAADRDLEVFGLGDDDRNGWLDLLMSCAIEPDLGRGRPTFVYDYPASQAALARIRHDSDCAPVTERFEVYVEGLELANGFHELTDPVEQRRRFAADLKARRAARRDVVAIDELFLAALEAGLPDCAGVALGVDRLVMAALGADRLEEALAFPVERA